MNERLKELAVQAGLEEHVVHGDWTSLNWPDVRGVDLERFAELVRLEETKACAKRYLEIMREVVEQAVLNEREACAKLCEDLAYQSGSDHEAGGMYWCAEAIRQRGESKHE